MSYADILKKLAETNVFAAELLAARQRTKEKVKIEKQAALEVVQEPEKLITDEDIICNPESSFADFCDAANRLDGFEKGSNGKF